MFQIVKPLSQAVALLAYCPAAGAVARRAILRRAVWAGKPCWEWPSK